MFAPIVVVLLGVSAVICTSFAFGARLVRDASLPFTSRVNGLKHCVERFRPLGYNATWSYLTAKVGPPAESEEALIAALELLERARRRRIALAEAYAARRRVEKRSGMRYPRRGDGGPDFPNRWHEDEATGARIVLLEWRERDFDVALLFDRHGAFLVGLIDDAVNAPERIGADDRAELCSCITQLHAQIERNRQGIDASLDRRTWQLHWLGWQITMALGMPASNQ